MQTRHNPSLLEHISHITEAHPFSIHHTIMNKKEELILYLHWHSEIEFLYIEKGETIFCIEGNEYRLKAGDAIFVPPNLLHMAKGLNGSGCEFYAFVFSPSYLSEAYSNTHYTKYILPIMHNSLRCCLHLTSDIPWQNTLLINLHNIFFLPSGDIDQWELQLHGTLLILWQLLYNNHLSKIEASRNLTKLTSQLEKAINLIHNSYDDELSLHSLANISNLSDGQFCRVFKQFTGFTPFCYLNRYRILESCKYLACTSKKIAEIATLCGFNNISYYNREFMKIIGMTPSAYRRMVQ